VELRPTLTLPPILPGPSLERSVGTVAFAYVTILFAVLGGGVHALAGAAAGHGRQLECAAGLSGVLFALIVVDSHLTSAPTRSLFGVLSVPTRWYPLALLGVLQLLLPTASVAGHLSGVLVGYAFVWGWLNRLLLSPAGLSALERARCCASCVARPAFILSSGLPEMLGGGPPRWAAAAGGGGGAPELRAPAWLSRAWAQAREVAADAGGAAAPAAPPQPAGPFAGRGRAVGTEQAAAAAVAAAAAAQPQLSVEARARAARAAELRAAGGRAQPAGAGAIAAAEAGLLPSGSARLEGVPPGLEQLRAMGFGEAEARRALVATAGDISAALDLLSS